MKHSKISIIVPVYNEEIMSVKCLNALIGLDYPKDDFEIIVVNDGSTDNTLQEITNLLNNRDENTVEVNIINLKPNQGRVIAREEGAKKSKFNNLLFIDSRCIVRKNILKEIKNIDYNPIIGRPVIDYSRSIYDRFMWLTRKKIYSPYFGDKFPPVYITKENFDKIGKGLGMFFCDKDLFLSSQLKCKDKHVSDDVKIFKNIIEKRRILKHPDVIVDYYSRTSLKNEVKHIYNRGPKFVDYYLNIKKRNFWIFIFIPIIIINFLIVTLFINIFYLFYSIILIIITYMVISIWLAENKRDFFIVLGLLPVFALSFELGIIKGLFLKLFKRY